MGNVRKFRGKFRVNRYGEKMKNNETFFDRSNRL